MTIKMDPRSLVVGAAVAVVALTSMGIAGRDRGAPRDADKIESAIERLSAVELYQKLTELPTERFQVESTEVYTVILDTATGQAWRYHLATGREYNLCPPKIKPTED